MALLNRTLCMVDDNILLFRFMFVYGDIMCFSCVGTQRNVSATFYWCFFETMSDFKLEDILIKLFVIFFYTYIWLTIFAGEFLVNGTVV